MPEEFFFVEPERVRCVKVKLPVVLAEEDIQVTIDNTTCLPELAKKIEKIDAKIRDVEVEPFYIYERPNREDIEFFNDNYYYIEHTVNNRVVKIKRLTIHGTLHKQIYYVNKDNDVRHFSEDIPFTKTVNLDEKFIVFDEDEVYTAVLRATAEINWNLVKSSRLHQVGSVSVRIKLIEGRQLYVQVCPSPEETCPNVNLIRDPSIEAWSDELVPVFWGGSNISRTEEAYAGQYAVEIGAVAPDATGSVFQTISRNIYRGQQYKLTFHARENVIGDGTSAFTLVADVAFYDRDGEEIDVSTKSFDSADIPNDSYRQISVETGKVPEEATTALVRFTFNPEDDNTNAVKIDRVIFKCQR